MFNKIYEFLKKNRKEIIIFLIFVLLFTIPLPYYIDSPGGTISLKKRFEIEDSKEINGDISLVYVAERDGTIPNILLSFILKDWDLVKKEDVIPDNETVEENAKSGKISLEQSYNNALVYAFKKANKNIEITDTKVYVTYVSKESKTDLKVGDQILSINGEKVVDRKSIANIIDKIDEKLEIKVLNDNKEYNRYADIILVEGLKKIGIVVDVIYDYKLDQNINFKTEKKESGSSGGFANALYIYASIIDEDIIKGRKIIATGTINDEGIIGPIGGVKYKLKTASKDKADVFFISKSNCEEALEIKNENNYNLNIICIDTFDEAINYLK